ncbi:hypothetical protein CAOG_002895 [Capsaspora owczarzaki ATCC 30864]|uniref:Uncharacterized protein n=2 Tax=Capsaspora owczarzaki (strain ATCC 30864) TaxID=595528 RepID=A0A0D2WN87_CAPO3|nr:hypothetical protein CAOG_002895 [Capsaspora owczarzaki ATCC 30864]
MAAANPAPAPFSEQLRALAACLGVSVDLAPISELADKPDQRAMLMQLLDGQQAGTVTPTDEQKTADAAAALLQLDLGYYSLEYLEDGVTGTYLLKRLKWDLSYQLTLDRLYKQIAEQRQKIAGISLTG